MSNRTTDSRRTIILVVTVALATWSLFGLLDLPKRPYGGFEYDASSVVTSVTPGAPAGEAGLQVGDRILSIDGIPLSETERIQRQPRAAVGETHQIVVEPIDVDAGTDTEKALNVIYASDLAAHPIGLIGGAVLGLVFLFCGAVTYWRAPTQQTLLFAIAGFCLAGLLVPEPHVTSYGLRSFLEALKFLVALPAFAVLLHLMMIFPEPRRLAKRPAILPALYLPAILLGVAGALEVAGWGRVGAGVTVLATLALGLYVFLSVIAVIHRFAGATREARVAHGLSLMLCGIVVGFGPLAVETLATMVAPSIPLPGRDYYFLTMALIPLSFAAALGRWSTHAHGASVSADSDRILIPMRSGTR